MKEASSQLSPPDVLEPEAWSAYLRETLQRYDAGLARSVMERLCRPRNQWPVDELIDRGLATLSNAAVIDRRLAELGQAERRLLGLIGRSRRPRWRLGGLLELLAALGHADGTAPVFQLFQAGLLYPDLSADFAARLRSFEHWLGLAGHTAYAVFAHPLVTRRVVNEDLGLPDLSAAGPGPRRRESAVLEADGLDWPLRLAVLWQQVAAAPLRRTQQGGFFKRDLDRLRGDPLLSGPAPEQPAELPDPGLLAVALAEQLGILQERDGELHAGRLPENWNDGLLATLASLAVQLPQLPCWNPCDGWCGPAAANPHASAAFLALLVLDRLPDDAWARADAVENWIARHHPFWSRGAGNSRPATTCSIGMASFLLGLAYPLKLVQAVRRDDGWLVRLSKLGRWLVGQGDPPALAGGFAKTLLVQPNLEIIAYRQGLTPALVAQLTQVATWKSLGAACTLQLGPESVYRALEAGQTFATICRTLENHSTRPLPPSVVDSLRTWSDKRERITLYPSATLFEFAAAADLHEALARGFPGTAISERLAIVAREADVDFRHYRLTGTRDYALPPEQCVEVEDDGISVAIDLSRSDLLVETELQRFADPAEPPDGPSRPERPARWYRVTPESLGRARQQGVTARQLEDWFQQRSGQPLSAAIRMLLAAPHLPAAELRQHWVLRVASADLADGLLQWPETRSLILARLGPTTLAIAAEHTDMMRQRLQALGLPLQA